MMNQNWPRPGTTQEEAEPTIIILVFFCVPDFSNKIGASMGTKFIFHRDEYVVFSFSQIRVLIKVNFLLFKYSYLNR